MCPVLCDVLVVLTSGHAAVRQQGLAYIRHLHLATVASPSHFLPCLKKVNKAAGEIAADGDFIEQVGTSWFTFDFVI